MIALKIITRDAYVCVCVCLHVVGLSLDRPHFHLKELPSIEVSGNFLSGIAQHSIRSSKTSIKS